MSMAVTAGAAPQAPSYAQDSVGGGGAGQSAEVDAGLQEAFERALDGGDRERPGEGPAGRDGRDGGSGEGGFGGRPAEEEWKDAMARISGGIDGGGVRPEVRPEVRPGVLERPNPADAGRMPGGDPSGLPDSGWDAAGRAGLSAGAPQKAGPAEGRAGTGPDGGASAAPGRDGEREAPKESSLPSPESLLQGLFGAAPATGAPAAARAEAPAPASPAELDAITDRLVERILVSEPGRGDPEVRISLGDGRLAGTELHISRSQDGILSIRLECPHESAFQTAVAARDDLRAALEKDGGDVRVEVRRQDGAGGGNEGDSRRRSATWREAGPDGDES